MNPSRVSVLIGGLCALVAGCAPVPPADPQDTGQKVFISGLVIRNELPYPVTDVMIEVPATGGFAGCGNILPRSACRNEFQRIDYSANAVTVRWKEHGQPQQTDEFVVRLPEGAVAGSEFLIEVIVFAPGQAGAHLVDAVQPEVRNR